MVRLPVETNQTYKKQESHSQGQSREAQETLQQRALQIEAVFFHIAKYFFDPHAGFVET
jgi:hypothetical protein